MFRFTRHGPVDGTTVRWHDEEGWGAVASPEVEGQVWVHFSVVVMAGHRTLTPGQVVRFTYQTPGQDGYPHSARRVTPL